ncbi:MAG: hypothetical protein ACR2MK_12035 [Solirubrobacteraceae bacterium]
MTRWADSNVLVWFGVLGGALAWAVQFVAGLAFGLARCSSPDARWQVSVHAWALAFAIAGALVAVLAQLAAIQVYRTTREAGSEPPAGRRHFLATIGMTVNPLALAIIIMSAVGLALFPLCRQS